MSLVLWVYRKTPCYSTQARIKILSAGAFMTSHPTSFGSIRQNRPALSTRSGLAPKMQRRRWPIPHDEKAARPISSSAGILIMSQRTSALICGGNGAFLPRQSCLVDKLASFGPAVRPLQATDRVRPAPRRDQTLHSSHRRLEGRHFSPGRLPTGLLLEMWPTSPGGQGLTIARRHEEHA